MRKMKWTNTKPATGTTVEVYNEEQAKMLAKSTQPIGKIIMMYTNWSEDTFFMLARKHCSGVTVQIKNTVINSRRHPRPYLPNASAEELAEIKRLTTVQNNKTSYAFVKEVAYLVTKAYGTNPLDTTLTWRSYIVTEKEETVDANGVPYKKEIVTYHSPEDQPEYRLYIKDERFPKTKSWQQYVEGVEQALSEIRYQNKRATGHTQRDVDIRCRLYADSIDYNKHMATKLIAPAGLKKKDIFYIPITEEVFTWQDKFRTTTNREGDKYTVKQQNTYLSDIRTYPAMDKLNEAKEILDWLEQHDMLDLHAYKCPNCGHNADTFTGCDHCGYVLPEEASFYLNKGCITAEELSAMPVDAIEKEFLRDFTSVSYEEWRTDNDESAEDTFLLKDNSAELHF